MITFGRKLKHLRQKNHLTQKELGGMAVGFPIAVLMSELLNAKRCPRHRRKRDLMKLFASALGVRFELFTMPALRTQEYEAAGIGDMS